MFTPGAKAQCDKRCFTSRKSSRSVLSRLTALLKPPPFASYPALAATSPLASARERFGERLKNKALRQAVGLLWEAADRICGKLLRALLPVLIESMERHGHLRLDPVVRSALLDISVATIDRVLRPVRAVTGRMRRRCWGIGSAIRQSVPVRTFDDWGEPPQCSTRSASQ